MLTTDHKATDADRISHGRSCLAHYKCPTSVEFRTESSRTATGKLEKFELHTLCWEGCEKHVE